MVLLVIVLGRVEGTNTAEASPAMFLSTNAVESALEEATGVPADVVGGEVVSIWPNVEEQRVARNLAVETAAEVVSIPEPVEEFAEEALAILAMEGGTIFPAACMHTKWNKDNKHTNI